MIDALKFWLAQAVVGTGLYLAAVVLIVLYTIYSTRTKQ